MTPHDFLFYLAVTVVSVISAARITRLLTFDAMPVFGWLRDVWDRVTGPSSWNLLMHCHYCASVWVFPVVLLSGYFSDWHIAWWLFNASLAGAYVAAAAVSYDGDDS